MQYLDSNYLNSVNYNKKVEKLVKKNVTCNTRNSLISWLFSDLLVSLNTVGTNKQKKTPEQ